MSRNDYMLALAEACGWLDEQGRDGYSEEGEPISKALRKAAQEWWDKLSTLAGETVTGDKATLRALQHALTSRGSGFSDGTTDYYVEHSPEAGGWFIITENPEGIQFLADEDESDLPDLASVQAFDVVFYNGGVDWEIVFGTVA